MLAYFQHLINLLNGKCYCAATPKLGKHTTGKGCLYIKKLADVDQKLLEALVVRAVTAKRRGSRT